MQKKYTEWGQGYNHEGTIIATPRTVVKSMTIKHMPSAQEVLQEMKKLGEEGLASKMQFTTIPNDNNTVDRPLVIKAE